MKLTILPGILLPLVVCFALAAGAQDDSPGKSEIALSSSPDVSVVLDLKRPSDTDILLLRNGDQLTGTILNENFSLRTSYASLQFHNRILAGVDLEGGSNNIERIVTVNGNQFSGFIDDPVVVFKLQAGATIQIRREKILKIVFRVREAEKEGIPQSNFIVLKNGDYFSGKLLNENLVIATTYADVPLEFGSLESITLIGENNPLTMVSMLNGDIIQGVLKTEDVHIDLDIGDEISVYKDRIDILYGREGFIPELPGRAAGRIVYLESEIDNYDYELPGDSIRVLGVPEDSEYYGLLQGGDRIIAVDGVPYPEVPEREYKGQPGRITPMRGELLDGKRAEIVLTVERDGKKFELILVRK